MNDLQDSPDISSSNTPTDRIKTSAQHWFGRGLGAGMIFVAAMNAASFLWCSETIGHLFDGHVSSGAALGFPLEIWSAGKAHTYGRAAIDLVALFINGGVAIGFGSALGLLAIWQRAYLTQWVRDFETESKSQSSNKAPLQFSIVNLLAATLLVAMLAAAVTHWAGTRELLWFIYVLGPVTLIGIAFLPRNIRWQSRCVILTIAAVIVIAGAIWSGQIRGVEFDKVLMGIYVFWTPQGAFAALGMILTMFLFKRFGSSASLAVVNAPESTHV